MSMDWQSTNTMLYTATARYDWSNDKHSVGALVGTSYEHYKYERLAGSREEFQRMRLQLTVSTTKFSSLYFLPHSA